MSTPDSFCAISTKSSCKELLGLLLSLSLHHPCANFICMVDSYTKDYIVNNHPDINLKIEWIVSLNEYTNMNRSTMSNNMWLNFMNKKAEVVRHALNKYDDTLFMDGDLFVLGKINNIDKSKDLGVSPHYMAESRCKSYGYYNGGLLWCKNKNIPDKWIEYSNVSRFFDQASIEDLVKEFTFFEFDKNYNFGMWRFNSDSSYVNIKDNKLMFGNNELKIIHIHFHKYHNFKNFIISKLKELNRDKELEYINKILK